MLTITDDEFSFITGYIKTHYGVDLGKKRPLIEGRLSNYVRDLGFDNYMDYFKSTVKDPTGDAVTMLINKLTTNHTYFFRENEHFEFYRDRVLPWVDKDLRSKDLRVWSAGCSSGQEPYTLSMITLEYLGKEASSWDSTVLASDISSKVLSVAREGIYHRDEVQDVPHSWIKKYFHPHQEEHFAVSDALRKNVAYRSLNLLDPFQFKRPFHTIFCRNVMIYFDIPTKDQLINKFYDALLPGGYFMIGHSESLSACTHRFKYIKPSIYQKVE